MELKINTNNKTIEVLGETKISDLMRWIIANSPDYEEYSIIPTIEYIERYVPQYPVVYRDTRVPYTDWFVTSITNK